MNGEFVINEDLDRGIKTVGWFEPDGRMTVQTRQYIPDSFFAEVEMRRQIAETRVRGTQSHWHHIGMIPSTVLDMTLVDSDGKPLQHADPERQKKLKKLLNDSEFRKLRISEGNI